MHCCPTCGLPPLDPVLLDVLVDGRLRLDVLRDDRTVHVPPLALLSSQPASVLGAAARPLRPVTSQPASSRASAPAPSPPPSR